MTAARHARHEIAMLAMPATIQKLAHMAYMTTGWRT